VRDGLAKEGATARVDAVGDRLRKSDRWQGVERLRLHALPHYALYRTRDDRWLSVGIVDEDKFWAALCDAVGLAPLGSLPMLARFMAGSPLRRLFALQFRRRDLEDWLDRLDRTKIPVAPVLTVREALSDLQICERRVLGAAHVHAPFPLATDTPAASPRLGEHTEDVLRAWARQPA
jgi:crotonobetainyl-CoA:carnitine CoA-transferase CaiB-like acyl-CoA transferase